MRVQVFLCVATLALLIAMAESTYVYTGFKCDGKTETIFCESTGSKRTKCNCNLGPIKDAEIIHEKSNHLCKKFKTWGFSDNYIWVSDCCAAKFKVCIKVKKPCDGKKVYQECASKKHKRTECDYNNGLIKSVDLIKEDSHKKCKENVTWGYTETYIWVDRGCDAKFILCAKDKRCKEEEVIQSCGTKGSKRNTCSCDVGKIIGVKLLKENSHDKCLEGKTWYFTENYIWVENGCDAEFKICVREIPCDGKEVYKECISKNYKRRECDYNNGLIKSAKILKEISNRKCYAKRTWGYTSTSVWVDKGCGAKFLLCAKDKPCDEEKVFQSCASKYSKRNTCSCEVGKIKSVKFLKGDTKKCLEGKSWGFTEDYVWVDDGCSAKFELCVKEKPCDGDIVFKKCESLNYKSAVCKYKYGTIKHARVDKLLSKAKCIFGKTWGYKKDSIWVKSGCRAFFKLCVDKDKCRYDSVFKKCESWKGKPNKCEYDDGTITGVDLYTEYSKNECHEGKSWGFNEDSIWVNSGCRAKFKLCVKDKCDENNIVVTTCTSYKYKRTKCGCHGGPIKSVVLIKQLTKDPCIKDKTWGYDKKNIWVSGCCSAKFKICIDRTYY